MKKLIIISNENEYSIEPYEVSFDDNIEHSKKYISYVKENNLSITSRINIGYIWGKTLCLRNFLNISEENGNAILFIPENLSYNQYNWLISHKEYIEKYDFSLSGALIISFEEGKIIEKELNIDSDFWETIEQIYKEAKSEHKRIN